MSKLGETASYVRSKNAGPFWVTVDIFCGSEAAYEQVARSPNLNARRLAQLLGVRPEGMKLFRLPALRVVRCRTRGSSPRVRPASGTCTPASNISRYWTWNYDCLRKRSEEDGRFCWLFNDRGADPGTGKV